jgi:NAD(P) transhydrogenase subunit alpha
MTFVHLLPMKLNQWVQHLLILELEALEGAGGYAREMTEERAAKQRELLTPYIAKSHVVITTAAVPGRHCTTIDDSRRWWMRWHQEQSSLILAAETGGNVEGSKPGEIVKTSSGVQYLGWQRCAKPTAFPCIMFVFT